MDLSPLIAATADALRARLLTARRLFVHPDGRIEAADMDPAEVHERYDAAMPADTTAHDARLPPAQVPAQVPPQPGTSPHTAPVDDGQDEAFDPDSPMSPNERTVYGLLERQGDNWTANRALADAIGQTKESSGYKRVRRRLTARGLVESGDHGLRLRHRDPDP